MNAEDNLKFLSSECDSLEKERKRLRSILDKVADAIHSEARGHTPNWNLIVKRIEQYEDAYCPLGDE